ncbi:hypothetical protein OPIT5_01000 [Opitutaceae bacterium TAV5]|nr:hypothetical protein OPIT5_01000 [Opitutaceae bacterium TAV5]
MKPSPRSLLLPLLHPAIFGALAASAAAAPWQPEPGPDWAPYAHSVEIAPGGVFDFSVHVAAGAPAGKYGHLVVTPDGHFAFGQKPGDAVRFWGVNLCFGANFLERSEADRLAERLARSGYNTVRFHHFDGNLIRQGGSSWDIDPHKLDQLEYLFAAMKKRGIYISIDLFTSRGFSEDELAAFGFPPGSDRGKTQQAFKGLIPIHEAAFEAWSRFARNLLTHKNPHTGLTWAEDPALIGICPVNEDSLVNRVSHAWVLPYYKKAFVDSGAGSADEAGDRSSPAWNRFVYETHARSDARLFDYLRNTLKTRALLTGSNFGTTQGLAIVRQHYDYVDNHRYWDHPGFPKTAWRAPFSFKQQNATREKAAVPREIMATRIFGKPFTVTEFNFCRPNQYRAEGAVLMPAYASLQDWDALYNFQYAQSRDMALDGSHANYFAIAADPVGLIADRTSALLFIRRDIAPAVHSVAWALRPEEAYLDIWKRVSEKYTHLGLVSRIGSIVGDPAQIRESGNPAIPLVTGTKPPLENPLPPRTWLADVNIAARLQDGGVLSPGSIDAAETRYTSDTGQIELRSDTGAVRVVTPRSELFLLPPGIDIEGKCVSVAGNTAQAAISVIALDDEPLATTRRILVTHLTDALTAGARFDSPDRKLLEDWGNPPHLVRHGEATLTLRLPPGGWKAWTVDATGARVRVIPVHRKNSGFVMTLATVTPEGTQLACELVR